MGKLKTVGKAIIHTPKSILNEYSEMLHGTDQNSNAIVGEYFGCVGGMGGLFVLGFAGQPLYGFASLFVLPVIGRKIGKYCDKI